jgi:hypothetical protein
VSSDLHDITSDSGAEVKAGRFRAVTACEDIAAVQRAGLASAGRLMFAVERSTVALE